MRNIIEIDSLDSPALAVYARLTENQLKNRLNPDEAIFIAESPVVIEVAMQGGCEPISLLTDKRLLGGDVERIIEKCGDIPVYTAEREVLREITGFELTRGCLAAMRRPAPRSAEEVTRGTRRIAVLENITDATNVGAIFRSAAALGIDAVLVTPSCCDPLSRRAVRVSMGTVFLVPFATICENKDEWDARGIDTLRSLGFKSAAMALTDESVSISNEKLKAEDRLAIILGTEGTGLKKKTIADSDYTVKIPMYHGVDSLNVGAAAAIAFFELTK